MSPPPPRLPGFWNSVISARTSRKMTTQRAKLRKFGFIGVAEGPGEGRQDIRSENVSRAASGLRKVI
jgi:hypothetical protein